MVVALNMQNTRQKEREKSLTTESKAPRTCTNLLHLHVYFFSGHFYAVANVCRCFYCAKVFWVVGWLLTCPESPQIIFWSLEIWQNMHSINGVAFEQNY